MRHFPTAFVLNCSISIFYRRIATCEQPRFLSRPGLVTCLCIQNNGCIKIKIMCKMLSLLSSHLSSSVSSFKTVACHIDMLTHKLIWLSFDKMLRNDIEYCVCGCGGWVAHGCHGVILKRAIKENGGGLRTRILLLHTKHVPWISKISSSGIFL